MDLGAELARHSIDTILNPSAALKCVGLAVHYRASAAGPVFSTTQSGVSLFGMIDDSQAKAEHLKMVQRVVGPHGKQQRPDEDMGCVIGNCMHRLL